jgi:cytochrome c peroxidase
VLLAVPVACGTLPSVLGQAFHRITLNDPIGPTEEFMFLNIRKSKTIAKFKTIAALFAVCAAGTLMLTLLTGSTSVRTPFYTLDRSGVLSTQSTTGSIDLTNPFFQSLGSNGRSCSSCHQVGDAWSVTPDDIRLRFQETAGTDPIFRPVDGATCPSADVSSRPAREQAYSLLLDKGLIRISLPMPAGAAFSIASIDDPYNCPQTTTTQPALYRRPLPAANVDFLSAVMWDGRETVFGAIPGKSINLTQSLSNQATDAVLTHAQGANPPTAEQLAEITAFETALYTAQAYDWNAGDLTSHGATGGPVNLSTQNFYIGINDALGGDPTGAQFNPNVFTLYSNWAGQNNSYARQSVARGQTLFNTLPISITGVGGLNDALGEPVISGNCTTCHDSPNVGNHSFSVPLNIGTTAYPALAPLDVSGLPVYTTQCSDGTTTQVTDIGRAMVTGKCADIGKVKGPILRGLAGRAPYFHNGAARRLDDVVEFYNERFSLNLTDQQKSDLVAFLQTL